MFAIDSLKGKTPMIYNLYLRLKHMVLNSGTKAISTNIELQVEILAAHAPKEAAAWLF